MQTLAALLVLAATLYTIALCFINTRLTPLSNNIVAIADGAITLLALAAAVRLQPRHLWLAGLFLALNFLALAAINGGPNLKAIRDIAAPMAFFTLGLSARGLGGVRIVFLLLAAIVVGLGLFEYLRSEDYVKYFDVLQFYLTRGVVDQQGAQYVDTSLFVSAMRNAPRLLFPVLGPHRVSSIFLEPVSMGNFGALAFAWAMSLGRAHWRTAALAAAVGAFCIIMADARFGAFCVIMFVLAVAFPLRPALAVIAALPAVVIVLLILFGLYSGVGAGDDLPTRLAASGRALAALKTADWFGVGGGDMQTLDSGYYYAIKSFGAPLCAVLWLAFAAIPTPDNASGRMKLLIGIYICALLCVSGSSLFALKTAAFAWFALGVMVALGRLRQGAAAARDLEPAHGQTAPA